MSSKDKATLEVGNKSLDFTEFVVVGTAQLDRIAKSSQRLLVLGFSHEPDAVVVRRWAAVLPCGVGSSTVVVS